MLEIKCLNESTYIYFNSCMNHGMTRFDTKDRPRWRAHACVDRRQSSRWIGGRSSWGRGPVDHRGGSAHQWANGTARCFKWPKRPCSPLAVHRLRGPHGTVTNKTARPHPGKRRFVLNFSVQRHPFLGRTSHVVVCWRVRCPQLSLLAGAGKWECARGSRLYLQSPAKCPFCPSISFNCTT